MSLPAIHLNPIALSHSWGALAEHRLLLQLTEKLQDSENESMAKIAELEKQLNQARRELEMLRVRPVGMEEQYPRQGGIKPRSGVQSPWSRG